MWECRRLLAEYAMGGLICAQQSLVVLGAEEGGSCGFTSEVKEVVVHKISEEASCVWFSPLQPGLAKLASPTKLSQRGPERIFFLPRLGPQAQWRAPRRVGGWQHITAMQGLVAETSKWRDCGEEERWQASPVDFFCCLRGGIRAWKILASTLQQPETDSSWAWALVQWKPKPAD